MTEEMSKQKILDLIRVEWEALETVLARLNRDQMLQPGVTGDWSVKDLVAHLAAWEGKMVQWLEESLRGEVPDRPAPGQSWDDIDWVNEQFYTENRDKTLAEVLAAFRDGHRHAQQVIENLSEEELLDPHRFEWRKGDPMWHLVATNTWEHYQEHRETIENWLKERG
jgi:hypothetical protein